MSDNYPARMPKEQRDHWNSWRFYFAFHQYEPRDRNEGHRPEKKGAEGPNSDHPNQYSNDRCRNDSDFLAQALLRKRRDTRISNRRGRASRDRWWPIKNACEF